MKINHLMDIFMMQKFAEKYCVYFGYKMVARLVQNNPSSQDPSSEAGPSCSKKC